MPERPTSWQTFLQAHWGAIAGADFFTTEVWTARVLVTYYTLFVIDLASRRVQILGSTPHPDALFMQQVARGLVFADEGALVHHRILICDRDAKWSRGVRQLLTEAGLHVVQTPYRAPNANAHAERFVRSIKEECLNRVVPLGERHFRQTVAEFVVHYHRERPHQGRGNALLEHRRPYHARSRIRRRPPSRRPAQLLRARRLMPRPSIGTLRHPDAKESEYDVDRLMAVWDLTYREDRWITENNHHGIMNSRYNLVGGQPYAAREGGPAGFVKWYMTEVAPIASAKSTDAV